MRTRYSDIELDEFKALIEQKLSKANRQLAEIQGQLTEVNESNEDGFGTDIMEDSSVGEQIDFLNEMVFRQKKHIGHLENALIRIQNKTYGVCSITGELIDKRRLMAVPTTTKSLAAKVAVTEKKGKVVREREPIKKKKPVIITKIIKKPEDKAVRRTPIVDDDDDLDMEDNFENTEFDFDSIADSSSDIDDLDFDNSNEDDDL